MSKDQRPKVQSHLLWTPYPNSPQALAFTCQADELYYGGAAGGGKTDLALGLAVTAHRRSLILRREATQLRGIVERSREIIGEHGRLNEVLGIWRGLPGGRMIEFGGCKDESDKTKYQGRPHDLIVFDEAPEFLESTVSFITGWARSEVQGQRVRVLLTGNPPTNQDGMWIIRRYAPWLDETFPDPAAPFELRWFAVIEGKEQWLTGPDPIEHKGERIVPRSRTFIPARLEDNPAYANSGYRSVLQALPEPLRSQMLYGDFRAGMQENASQLIPMSWIRAAQQRWQAARAKWDADPQADPGNGPLVVGQDVACGGSDQTVEAFRRGNWVEPLLKHPGKETPDGPSAARFMVEALANGGTGNIDRTGYGQSCYDFAAGVGLNVYGVNFSEKSHRRDRSGRLGFKNIRAEMYWALREALNPECDGELMLPPDPELASDLAAPTWLLTPGGIQIESKDAIKERIGRSPDCGDALALTFINCDGPTLTWL